ncbi:5-adenylylsulfate reductase-like 5 [Striga hermonthica]|uniref:5-adenylylsulfate reductase-like 5 n=1 Tax=Striga hermonthica TaxID=68872 RepID=A0A9N7NEE5_STRHE|nr:5-adenylylsulfate reductase-like 5 [Striga hermonthica]
MESTEEQGMSGRETRGAGTLGVPRVARELRDERESTCEEAEVETWRRRSFYSRWIVVDRGGCSLVFNPSMEVAMRKCVCVLLLLCVFMEPAMSAGFASSSSICGVDYKPFLHNLNSRCPFADPFSSSPPIQVDDESLERVMRSSQKNEYTAVLFYASWCPFSSIFQSKFSILSSMYPQIKHVMVDHSSAMPSVFSRYGIHSVPTLLIVNQTARMRYHGHKNLQSLKDFYKRSTGMDPLVDMVENTSKSAESGQGVPQLWNRASFKETFSREPYLVLSVIFIFLRAFLYIYPEIASRILALWTAYIPHLNLGIFGESKQLLGHILHLIDVKRIWSKLKICKTRNFHRGARNARVWASSIASVSLGEASSSRVHASS